MPFRRRETRFLILCARTDADPARVRALASGDLDWRALRERASRCGIAPMVDAALKGAAGSADIPAEALQMFEGAYLSNARRNETLFGHLARILSACGQKRIPVIVLKGAALVEEVYADRGLRQMVDLDLLIQSEHLQAVDRMLDAMDYPRVPEDGKIKAPEWYAAHHQHLAPRRSRDGACMIEIHSHIVGAFSPVQLPIADLWRRSRPARIAGVAARVLAPEDLLLHLCAHFFEDVGHKPTLRIPSDVMETIRRYPLDWDAVLSSARAYRMAKRLYYVLYLSKEVIGLPIPAAALRTLRHEARPGFCERMTLRFLLSKAMVVPKSGPVPSWLLEAASWELLQPRPAWRNFTELGTRIRDSYVQSARLQAAASRFPGWFYIACIHVPWLMTRAMGRAFRMRVGPRSG
ncbi:MAG: nucleotidyltransferase family protein [Acidimicrobiia bacterium]|nr:nucleotidyltransferase family protein [Acidimicrobiia bacterium]